MLGYKIYKCLRMSKIHTALLYDAAQCWLLVHGNNKRDESEHYCAMPVVTFLTKVEIEDWH